ncbi:hypothetical protein KPL70_027518 [Citrus sinensis]|nr:hypothetical protein KPL70_027518 [Citrus sinensis]
MAYRLVIKETSNPVQSKNPKIASMFLTQGSLPFELLWDKFSMYVIPVNGTFCHLWRGHEGRFSVYVHALRDKPVHLSRYFIDRDICSDQVTRLSSYFELCLYFLNWTFTSINFLNHPSWHCSCVPLHIFDYVYNYLMYSNVSFVDCYKYPGLHGNGRYSESMLPEAELKDLRKGVQMVDLGCIAYWSVIHVDWSEGKWHPKSYSEDSADAALPVERSQTAMLLIRREILS